MSDIIAMHRADLVDAVTEAVKPLKATIAALEGQLEAANELAADAMADKIAIEARCLLAEKDRDTLIEMTGLTAIEIAKRLNRLRLSKETPTISQQLKAKGYPRRRPKLPNDDSPEETKGDAT